MASVTERGGQELPLFRGINVVSIPIPDLDRARAFYGDTLGLGTPLYDLPEAGRIEFGSGGEGGNIAVTREGGDQPRGSGVTIVLNVPDCESAVAALRARGVHCDDPQTFPGYVTFASFYDTFGNRLQICSPA